MLRSLRARLVLTYAGLTLLSIGALSLYTVGSLEDLLLRRLADDLSAQARLVAEDLVLDLRADREAAVRGHLERIGTLTDARVMVVDEHRRVIGTTEASERDTVGAIRDDPALEEALLGETVSNVLPRARQGEVLFVAVPVHDSDGQAVGAVRLTYHLQDVEETLRTLNLSVAAGALATVLLAALVSFGFARTIANPVRELSRAAHAMAGGDLQQHLEPTSSDEVGELVHSFNQMAEKLRDADTARREFASDISHELHSLAGAMETAAEALERGAGNDEALRARLVGGLVGHTRRLNRLSEDLFQLAQLEEGRLKLDLALCSLSGVAGRTVDEFAAEAHRRGLELSLQRGADLLLVADEVRLQQALGNLVENAIKYTPGGGQVRVATECVNGDYLMTVEDNGQGIPPEELPHIWDRYYRVEGRASGGPGGTGLGLAIAAGIVKAHGGRIAVESVAEQGTRFTIHLPIDSGLAPL